MTSRAFDAIVIGGGSNGLVAAARLGQAGRRVLLLDAADAMGGQRRVVEFAPGYCASPLADDPGWVPPTISRALGLPTLRPVEVDAGLSVVTGSGEFLTLSRDARRAADAIRVHSASDARKWGAFTARLRNLARFLEVLYRAPAPDVDVNGFREWLALLSLAREFRSLGRRDMIEFLRTPPLSVCDLLDDGFESVSLKAAVATGGVRDLQQGPRSGGTGFVLLHHLVGAEAGAVRGRTPWREGPDGFTKLAESAARRFGAVIRPGALVARIVVRDGSAAGVALVDGEEIPSAAVLSTAGPAQTMLHWVDPVWLDPEFLNAIANVRHRGCTAFVLYALEALPHARGLHTPDALAGIVSLTPDLASLERAADAAKYGAVSETPHIELTIPTILWPAMAPAGRHVAVARVTYAPYRLKNQATWDDARRNALADRVTAAIEAAIPGFGSRVARCVAWSPADLEARFGLREGAATQGELGLDQILFMRPVAGFSRHTTPIGGLYLGGCGTHPGPGVLGGAGWLAAGRLMERQRGLR